VAQNRTQVKGLREASFSLHDGMAAFDRLPRKMRDCLNYSLLNFSAIETEPLVHPYGVDRIIHDIGIAESALSIASIENMQ
jgi:hypothetical protein